MSAGADQDIVVDRRGAAAWVVLNRPTKRNAVTIDMLVVLGRILRQLESDRSIRVLVLTGAGDDFSAGFDLTQPPYEKGFEGYLAEVAGPLLRALWTSPLPSIARVSGYCLGSGCELAMVCDFVVATEDSVIGEPELRYGILPDFLILPWLTSPRAAREMILAGERLTGVRAYQLGLATRAVPRTVLDETVNDLAKRLAAMPSGALARAKAALNRTYDAQGFDAAIGAGEAATLDNNRDPDDETREFRRIARTRGIREAIRWLDSRGSQSTPTE